MMVYKNQEHKGARGLNRTRKIHEEGVNADLPLHINLHTGTVWQCTAACSGKRLQLKTLI